MNKKSKIDIESTDGTKLEKLIGEIAFDKVEFSYPARESTKVLENLSLNVRPGQTVALVGASGCGKSTCIQLLQRFYDPVSGKITIDGVDVRDLNVRWWRNQVGVVNQEPVLFATTIGENIRMGKPEATQEEIELAAKNANAYDFIMALPEVRFSMLISTGSHLFLFWVDFRHSTHLSEIGAPN